MKIKKIIFDLDNTLIDTERIKISLDGFVMGLYGISRDQAEEIYKSARNDRGHVVFNRETYREILQNELNRKEIEYHDGDVERFFDKVNWKNFLLPGAIEILEYCQNKNMEIMLISLGNINWQLEKIRNVGLDYYFNMKLGNLILTSQEGEGKINALKRVLGENNKNGEGVVIVNDKPDETYVILREFSSIVALLRRETKDERYRPEIFTGMQDEFNGRIFVGDNLTYLTLALDQLIQKLI